MVSMGSIRTRVRLISSASSQRRTRMKPKSRIWSTSLVPCAAAGSESSSAMASSSMPSSKYPCAASRVLFVGGPEFMKREWARAKQKGLPGSKRGGPVCFDPCREKRTAFLRTEARA